MGYLESSIPANANNSSIFAQVIIDEMLVEGWTLVDTQVIATNTYKVLRCDASLNVLNQTYYLCVYYPTTGATSVGLIAFEDWNNTTKRAIRPTIAINGASVIDEATGSRYGSTEQTLNSPDISAPTFTVVASLMTYRLHISPTCVMGASSAATTKITYAGLLKPTARIEEIASGYDGYYGVCVWSTVPNFSGATSTRIHGGLSGNQNWYRSMLNFDFVNIPNSVYTGGSTGVREVFTPVVEVIAGSSEITGYPAPLGTLYNVWKTRTGTPVAIGDRLLVDGKEIVIAAMNNNISYCIATS